MSHLSFLNWTLHSADVFLSLGHAIYGPESDVENSVRVYDERVSGMCSFSSNSARGNFTASDLIDSLFKTYVNLDGTPPLGYWPTVPFVDASCVLVDTTKQIMWAISDITGSTPLWYSLSTLPAEKDAIGGNKFIITSDLIGARRLGFTDLTPLGSGQLLAIDMSNLEVLGLSQWQSNAFRFSQIDQATIRNSPDTYSKRLFAETSSIVNNIKNQKQHILGKKVTMELDTTDSSSLLLDCVLSALGVERAVRRSRALVADEEPPASAQLFFRTVLGKRCDFVVGCCRLVIKW